MTTKKKQDLKMVDFYEKYKYDKTILKKSKSWFQQEMLSIEKKRLTPPKLIANNGYGLHKTKMVIGKMYCFLYDAKLKKEVFNIFFKKCAAKLKKTLSVNFIFGDILVDISDSSEGGWYITIYPHDVKRDEDGEFNPDDELDGGLCDGSAFNAVTFFINLD
jgi:hypothetical protein